MLFATGSRLIKICIIGALLSGGFAGNAQSYNRDSLRGIIKSGKDDTTRLKARNTLADETSSTNPDSALKLWQQTDSLCDLSISNAKGKELFELYRIKGDVENNIGFVYWNQGLLSAALDFNMRSYNIRDSIGDKKGIAESLNNIAFVYLAERDTVQALGYFRRSEEGYGAVNDTSGVAITLINQALIYSAQHKTVLARKNFSKTVSQLKNDDSRVILYAKALNGMANVLLEEGDDSAAFFACREALRLRQENHDSKGVCGSHITLARIYVSRHTVDSALYYSRIAVQEAREVHASDLEVLALKLLADALVLDGNYKEAYSIYREAIAIRDSNTSLIDAEALQRRVLDYNYGKKIAADSTRNATQQSLLDAELKSSNQQRYFLSGILALVAIFSGLIYNRFRVTRRQKLVIEDQKKVVDQKQKEVLDSIHYATRIQQALLAGTTFLDQSLNEYFVLYKPKDIVSGDFYWATRTDNKFWLCAADCTGHGVPGAFMSLLNISFLNEAVNERKLGDPGSVLDYIRTKVINALATDGSAEGGKDGMDCILCCFNFAEKELTFSSANNALWLISSVNGVAQLTEFPTDKMPVGRHSSEELPFTVQTVRLKKGDVIYLFTDGYPDQFGGPKSKKFLYRRLRILLEEIASLPMSAQKEKLNTTFSDWQSGQEQIDDILIIGIRV